MILWHAVVSGMCNTTRFIPHVRMRFEAHVIGYKLRTDSSGTDTGSIACQASITFEVESLSLQYQLAVDGKEIHIAKGLWLGAKRQQGTCPAEKVHGKELGLSA